MGILMIQVGSAGIAAGSQFWSLAQGELQARQRQASGLPSLDRARAREHVWGMGSLFMLQEIPGAKGKQQQQLQSRALSVLMVDGARGSPEDGEGLLLSWFEGYRWAARQQLGEAQEATALGQALSSIQAQVALDPTPSDFILMCSWNDAAAAGLGSYVLEWLRKQYPFHCILVAAIMPDVTTWAQDAASSVQAINVVLSVQWAQTYADGILWFSTPEEAASSDSPEGHQQDVAASVGRSLAALLLPTEDLAVTLSRGKTITSAGAAQGSAQHTVGQGTQSVMSGLVYPRTSVCRHLVRRICPDPGLKFVQVFLGQAGTSVAWRVLATHCASIFSSLHVGSIMSAPRSTSMASLVVLRGPAGTEAAAEAEDAMRKACLGHMSHVPGGRECLEVLDGSSHASGTGELGKGAHTSPFLHRAALILSNSNAISFILHSVVETAKSVPLKDNLGPDETRAAHEAMTHCSNVVRAYRQSCS